MRALKRIEAHCLPDTATLLAQGGDARIAIKSGRNEYGCAAFPDPDFVELGSSTASTISQAGFDASEALRERLNEDPDCEREFDRIRSEFSAMYGLEGSRILFAPSGTDIHLIAAQLTAPHLVVMANASETGRGVPDALSGRHFSSRSAFCDRLAKGGPLKEGVQPRLSSVNVREEDGNPRAGGQIDEAFSAKIASGLENGKRVLLVLTDVSKTGMIVPSISCALGLKEKYGESLEILVDACQFRMAPATLRAYLDKGFMVALTGSKFMTGPTFSGALVIPGTVSLGRADRALSDYASGREWPESMRQGLGSGDNFGLLLRWEAAMAEMRSFRNLPEIDAARFLETFSKAVKGRLEADPHFELLSVPEIDRDALHAAPGWDRIQTIFPFRLKRKGVFLGMEGARVVHDMLRQDLSAISPQAAASMRCGLGQPVACGALRICSSARLVVEGAGNADAVIDRALAALDKVSLVLDHAQLPKRR